jgi:hypothetical protein
VIPNDAATHPIPASAPAVTPHARFGGPARNAAKLKEITGESRNDNQQQTSQAEANPLDQ